MINSNERLRIRHSNWESNKIDLQKIRRKVFIEEQNVPEPEEWDEYDEQHDHFLVYWDDQAIGCARLLKSGQVGRMAIIKEYRGQAFGSALLKFILSFAKKHGFKTVFLHAQTHAIPFYLKFGFTSYGEIFDDAGIPHQSMQLAI